MPSFLIIIIIIITITALAKSCRHVRIGCPLSLLLLLLLLQLLLWPKVAVTCESDALFPVLLFKVSDKVLRPTLGREVDRDRLAPIHHGWELVVCRLGDRRRADRQGGEGGTQEECAAAERGRSDARGPPTPARRSRELDAVRRTEGEDEE